VLLIGAITSWFSVRWLLDDLRPQYLKTMEESLVDTATILSTLVAGESPDGNLTPRILRKTLDAASRRRFEARIYDVIKNGTDIRVYITDQRGIVVYDSDGGRDEGKDYANWNDVLLTLRGGYGARTTRVNPDDPGSSVLFVASPIMSEGKTIGVLTVAKPSRSVNATVRTERDKMIAAGVAGVVAMLGLGIALSLWVTWPLRRLTAYADAVRDGKRVPLPKLGTFSQWGHSEVGTLGRAVEGMRDTLEGRRHLEKTVLALTHEVKGPLSAIRGAAELLGEQMPDEQRARFLENIRAESGRVEEIVNRLLDLAALESRRGLQNPREIDLAALAREVASEMEPRFDARRVTLHVETTAGPIEVLGESALLKQAILNLLGNAVDFTPLGGVVRMVVERTATGIRLRVEDSGPGIPEYALDRVFERFYSLPRPDTGRKSSGLGLSIVREIVELHGGSVSVNNGEKGGVAANVVLPVQR